MLVLASSRSCKRRSIFCREKYKKKKEILTWANNLSLSLFFWQTDTASVLLEAIGYIRFLHGQIEVQLLASLSDPAFSSSMHACPCLQLAIPGLNSGTVEGSYTLKHRHAYACDVIVPLFVFTLVCT
jgi:hypothetical protein